MTMREAEEFIASVPWRAVKMVEVGDTGKTPDPHEYVIKNWREVDAASFDAFVRLIKAEGHRAEYRAPYRPDHVMTNHYLEIDGWCYWFIYPRMLNRERAEIGSTSRSRVSHLDGRRGSHARSATQTYGPISAQAEVQRLAHCGSALWGRLRADRALPAEDWTAGAAADSTFPAP